MSGKVSMVMACYNKAPYLDKMLRSVCEQERDRVELVFVNDGSTDASMEIAESWRPRLLERGYEVVMHSQTNAGVAAAIKAGLERISGDYVCFPDADDELHPRYAAEMAEALELDEGLDFVVCGFGDRTSETGNAYMGLEWEPDFQRGDLLERCLLGRTPFYCWRYLFRASYVRKAGLPESIDTSLKGTQEPQVLIPLLGGGGTYRRINMPLYIYNRYAQNLAQVYNRSPLDKIMGDYHTQQIKAIETLPVSERRKLELASYARIGITMLCNMLSDFPVLDEVFYRAITNRILGDNHRVSVRLGRVIAYGSLGEVAKRVIPSLKGTPLWPSVFWDRAAKEDSTVFDGSRVTPVQPDILRPGDVILCLPKIVEVYEDARALAGAHGATALTYYETVDWLAAWRYGGLNEGERQSHGI